MRHKETWDKYFLFLLFCVRTSSRSLGSEDLNVSEHLMMDNGANNFEPKSHNHKLCQRVVINVSHFYRILVST